ncbi:MAG: cation:proton antiporter [Peptococcaceae bacterium]|nr:cation:proton antiporter [Peptococcaceae bacterium]
MEGNVVALTEQIMTLLSIVIFCGIIGIKLSGKVKLPDTVLFIVIGILAGPAVLGLIDFKDFILANQLILTFGAAYILYDGGREIELKVINKVKVSVLILATVGLVISTVVLGFFSMHIFHLSFIHALLIGVVISSTDPSVLVPLFKSLNIRDKIKQTIISESAFNDAVASIITFALVGVIAGGAFSLGHSLLELLKEAAGGLAVGCIAGYVVALLVSERKYALFNGHKGEVAVATVLGAYALCAYFDFSGFMAVFVIGIVFGNKEFFKITIEHEAQELHESFKEVLIRILRIMIFVILGTQIDFVLLGQYWKEALGVVAILIFVARPVSVICSVMLDRKAKWTMKEILFLMWTRETGVIPAALAGMLVSMGVPNAQLISSVTFMAIIITLAFQSSTKKYLAAKLGLIQDSSDSKPAAEGHA